MGKYKDHCFVIKKKFTPVRTGLPSVNGRDDTAETTQCLMRAQGYGSRRAAWRGSWPSNG